MNFDIPKPILDRKEVRNSHMDMQKIRKIFRKHFTSIVGISLLTLTTSCASNKYNYKPEDIQKGIEHAIKKKGCFGIKRRIHTKKISLQNLDQRAGKILNPKSILAMTYLKGHPDDSIIFIPNRSNISSPFPKEEIGYHEIVHSALTHVQSKELTRKIRTLGITVAINLGDPYIETPAYLVNELLMGKHRNLLPKIKKLYTQYGLNLACIDVRLR